MFVPGSFHRLLTLAKPYWYQEALAKQGQPNTAHCLCPLLSGLYRVRFLSEWTLRRLIACFAGHVQQKPVMRYQLLRRVCTESSFCVGDNKIRVWVFWGMPC
ncbi:hypothetical protein ACOMHN_023171 [Nucella lapillus]